MADFNVDVRGAPRVPSPVSPVSDNSTAEGINSFGNLLTGVGSVIGSALVQGKQTEALQKQNHVLDQLHQNILRHADLVDQGVQNSDAAYRRIRVLAAQASASNPALRDQITKMVNGDLAAGGLANNLVTGTQAEQDKHALEMQQKKEALTANFLDPSADEATQAQQIQNFNQFKLGKAKMEALRDAQALENSRLEEQSKRLGIANSSVSLQRNRLGLQQERAKIQYNQAIGQMALGELPNVTGKLDKIANDPNMTVDQKLEQTKLLRELYRGKLTGDALAAGADGVPASIAKSFDNIFQMREDMLTGKFQGDNAQAQLDSVIAQSQNAILTGDPKLLNIVALGTKIGAVDGTSRELIAQKVADMVHAGTKLPGINGSAPSSQPPNLVHTSDDERKDVSQYTRIVKENVADVVANKTTNPQHRDEAQTQMNTALDSIYKNSPNAPNPQALQTVVNMFAAPAIGKYLANPAHGVDKELQDKAANAYRAYYVTKVIPLIKDEYENTYVQTGIKASSNPKTGIQAEYTPRGKVIAPVYNNGTISFQFVGDQSQNTSAVQEAVKDMNKKISPILNTMVRADAHLNSSTNYDQYANDILGSLFPQENPDEQGSE